MLECVINVSEGIDEKHLARIASACENALLDVHSDAFHHRSVFTLGAPSIDEIVAAAQQLAITTMEVVDISKHSGVHPRFGAVDVVPFVALFDTPFSDALRAREIFANWFGNTIGVPCFLYGPERSLPEVRKGAFEKFAPDAGIDRHATAGACAVGARPILIAYNLWLAVADLTEARKIAKAIRRPGLRSLAFDVDGHAQVSCNLITPELLGPDIAFDLVAQHAKIERAELVGLLPESSLNAITPIRWAELDISPQKTIEARLERAGLNEGKIH